MRCAPLKKRESLGREQIEGDAPLFESDPISLDTELA